MDNKDQATDKAQPTPTEKTGLDLIDGTACMPTEEGWLVIVNTVNGEPQPEQGSVAIAMTDIEHVCNDMIEQVRRHRAMTNKWDRIDDTESPVLPAYNVRLALDKLNKRREDTKRTGVTLAKNGATELSKERLGMSAAFAECIAEFKRLTGITPTKK